MKFICLMTGLVSTLCLAVFGGTSAKDGKPSITLRWEQWEKYEKDEEALRIRNDRIKSSGDLAEMLLQADARKVGLGTVLIEYTAGMCTVKKAIYSVQHGHKKVDLAIDQIDWMNHEMVVDLPGTLGQQTASNEQSFAVRCGDKVGKHLPQLTEKYGKGSAYEKSTTSALSRSEVMTWKVGDGHLEIETSFGVGIVKDIMYVIGNESEEQWTRIRVKCVDLSKGEMTIVIPAPKQGRPLK